MFAKPSRTLSLLWRQPERTSIGRATGSQASGLPAARVPLTPDSPAAGLGVAEFAQERPRDALDVGELLDGEITLETPDRAVVELHETPLECRRLDAEMLGNARRRLRQRLVAHLEHALAHGTRARHVRPPRPRRSRGIALVLERRA